MYYKSYCDIALCMYTYDIGYTAFLRVIYHLIISSLFISIFILHLLVS